MDDQNKNLILATALSFIVIIVWFLLFPPPETTQPETVDAGVSQTVTDASTGQIALPSATSNSTGATAPAAVAEIEETPRLVIDTDRLEGSISLVGGRIDDLRLKDYRETLDEGADIVTFLSPSGTQGAYYALYGWAAASGVDASQVPGPDTAWAVEGNQTLTVETPVNLIWDNGTGQTFRRTISVDEEYMFSIAQSVENTGNTQIALRPYGLIRRHGQPEDLKNFFILHEGLVRMSDGELQEEKYDNIAEFAFDDREGTNAERIDVAEKGWIGFTDHFWMTTLIPDQSQGFRSVAKYFAGHDIYQTEAVGLPVVLEAGQSATVNSQLFAGAKEWEAIRAYERAGIDGFLDSIDWGWFFFLTKPIFAVLHWLNVWLAGLGIAGSMGWAIIGLTLLIKAILFPLAYRSYASMAKMRELQPQMQELKERAGDDRQKMQQLTMELYKKEKVNPASGCLPILLQIPIFFSLYKVIFVTIELRHAPWIGWITDLSAPDPTSILNLFGLLSNPTPDPNSFFFIFSLGVLPILLGVSMWLQQKLNPAPTDPTQQMIFAWMPWVFMFMLGTFASGLVIYWIANNMITFIQQYLIMRSHGYKPDVFGNILNSFKRKPKAEGK